MCFLYSDPISLSRWWFAFSLQLHISLLGNAVRQGSELLALKHAQRPRPGLRSPLLTLHVEQLKLTPKLTSSEPRRERWLKSV